jgi:hypothetical protein
MCSIKLLIGVEGYFYSASYGISYRAATTAGGVRTDRFFYTTPPTRLST